MAKSNAARARDVVRNGRHIYKACPLCDSEKIRLDREVDCTTYLHYHKDLAPVMRWFRCEACRHSFTEGYYTDEALALLFRHTHEGQKPAFNFENARFQSAPIVERVARFASIGTWCDVGFGNGSLMFTAQEWGFELVGLDLRADCVEDMNRLGIEAHCRQLIDMDGESLYSVISMADVLEHTAFPKEQLAAAHRLLEDDGILFISLPHYGCMAWRLLDEEKQNPFWYEMEHYHNFSRERLYKLLKEMGFTPLNYAISMRYRLGMEVIARKVG